LLLALAASLIVALQAPERQEANERELYSVDGGLQAEGLQSLPQDYSQIPREQPREVPELGPPLPGDLGGPILSAQGRPPPGQLGPQVDQARTEEENAARTSGLFVDARTQTAAMAPPLAEQQETAASLQTANSPYVIQAGTVIPAALISGIRSDTPGLITAQVTRPVHDSATGQHMLIPQGARLIGRHGSDVSFGQRRLQAIWTRLIFPDGRSIALENLPAADLQGFAGLEDQVDNHWDRLFLAAGLSTILNLGAEISADAESDTARALRDGFQGTIGGASEDIIRRQLDIAPTLTIRPGFPITVIVARDLELEPL
jgi:type IV secretion system protein VirB10